MRKSSLGTFFWVGIKTLLIWSGALYTIYSFIFLAEERGRTWSSYSHGFSGVTAVGLTIFTAYISERIRYYGLLIGFLAVLLSGFALVQTQDMGIFQCDDGGSGECWTGLDAGAGALAVTAILMCCIFLLSLALSFTKQVHFSALAEKKKHLLACSALFVIMVFLGVYVLDFVKGSGDISFWLYPLPCLLAFYFGRLMRTIDSFFWRLALLLLFVGMLAVVFFTNFSVTKIKSGLSASVLGDIKLTMIPLLFIVVSGFFVKPYQYFQVSSPDCLKKKEGS